jgi:SEC-C motif domain protein
MLNMADNCRIPLLPVTMSQPATCPCGGASLATCCGPYISGESVPQSAEALMRSRYTAYTQRNEAYLRATWHPSTLPSEPIIHENERLQWLGLEVKSALRLRQRKAELPENQDADTVEFVARFKDNGRAHRLHEVSRFVREDVGGVARWFYLDGSFPDK